MTDLFHPFLIGSEVAPLSPGISATTGVFFALPDPLANRFRGWS